MVSEKMNIEPSEIGEIDYCDENEHMIIIGKVWLQFSWSGLLELRKRIDEYILSKVEGK